MTESDDYALPGYLGPRVAIAGTALIQDLLDRDQPATNDVFDSTLLDMPYRGNRMTLQPKNAGTTWYSVSWLRTCCIGIASVKSTMTSGQPPARDVFVLLKDGCREVDTVEISTFVVDFLLLYREKAAKAAAELLAKTQQQSAAA